MDITKPRDRPGGTKLRDLRQEAGLSQQRLAELAGCSLASVGLFESGYTPQRSAVLERLIAVLNDETQAGRPASRTTSAVTATDHERY